MTICAAFLCNPRKLRLQPAIHGGWAVPPKALHAMHQTDQGDVSDQGVASDLGVVSDHGTMPRSRMRLNKSNLLSLLHASFLHNSYSVSGLPCLASPPEGSCPESPPEGTGPASLPEAPSALDVFLVCLMLSPLNTYGPGVSPVFVPESTARLDFPIHRKVSNHGEPWQAGKGERAPWQAPRDERETCKR